jgi:hypothetical protein
MDPAAVVAIVFALIFIIGVVVGVITVIAMSVLRSPRPPHDGPGSAPEDDDDDDQPAASGIPGHWDEGPRWPGNTDSAR